MMYGGCSISGMCALVYNIDNSEKAMKITQKYKQERFYFKCLQRKALSSHVYCRIHHVTSLFSKLVLVIIFQLHSHI